MTVDVAPGDRGAVHRRGLRVVHFFLADGPDVDNAGISLHWADAGYPVADADDPGVYEGLVERAADRAGHPAR